MDNITKNFLRNGRNEFIQFLFIARGSASEVKSQLHRAFGRSYINKRLSDNLYNQSDELGKSIGGFKIYLRKSELGGTKFKRGTVPDSKS